MVYDKHIWFNPAYLIQCGFEAARIASANDRRLSSAVMKAINESRATSIWALAVNRIYNLEQIVQLAGPDEQTPDTRVMHDTTGPLPNRDILWGEYIDVEVVTYGEHSDEPIELFLRRTKLTTHRAYQQGTVILCYINRDMSGGKFWHEISQALQGISLPLDVFLLGKTHPTEPKYAMARIYPTYDSIIHIDVLEEAKRKYANPAGTRIVNFATDRVKVQLPAQGYNPFL